MVMTFRDVEKVELDLRNNKRSELNCIWSARSSSSHARYAASKDFCKAFLLRSWWVAT